MTISQLEYVLAVAKHRNFTEAAKHSFVTQPTLSMQIQKLEEELGVQIFNRKKKPIELTGIGQKIVEQAQLIVNESQRMNDIVDQQKGFVGGEFRLGIIPTIIPTLLPLFLKVFIKKYPKVNLIINELTTEEMVKQLANGTIDVGIAATPLEHEFIKERPLYYEPFVGFVPTNHRLFEKKTLRADDLDIEEILLLEDGHCFKNNIINLCPAKEYLKIKNFELESGSINTLIKLTKEGMGMTLLPYLDTLDLSDKDKVLLREFEKPFPSREVSLIYHQSQLKIQLINALKSTIDSVVRGAINFSDVKIVSPL
ncbi:MAG: DNA-binding transcriptional regulator OxyR [Flavobacteriia bacterium]|nr:MAG: DNA-binding transcriptional regulator OxyR [Flavobacteriia bacterium]